MSIGKTIYTEEHRYLVARLRKAREQARLTQKQVAQQLGVTQSFISKVENSQYRLDVIQLKEFAGLYKKSISFFLK